jgi:predicted membrane-bound mannosyltransferase
MGVGIGFALLWTKMVDARTPQVRPLLRWKVLVGAGVVGLVVAAILFSGLFTNWRGPIDAVRTYSTYLHRSTGEGAAGPHDKAFDYYVRLLLYWRYGKGPIHSEAFIVFLAMVGVCRALWPSFDAELGRAVFLRFLAFYTIALMLIYSAIPYKTPWCLVGFLHGMILLAGVGAVTIVRLMPHVALRYIVAGLLFIPAGNLAFQAHRINFVNYKDQRFNPYLYSTPVGDFMRLVDRIREVAKVSASRKAVSIKVVSADVWPLPWYLRDFENVSYYTSSINARPELAYIIIGSADDAHLDNLLSGGWIVENYGLRRQVILSVYIEKKLWAEMPFNKVKTQTR